MLMVRVFRSFDGTGGVGVVVRNELGDCVAAFALHFLHAGSAAQMEAEACREGMLIAIDQELTEVVLECDSVAIVAALTQDKSDLSILGRIIEDCRAYKVEFTSIQVRHIFREANGVAHS